MTCLMSPFSWQLLAAAAAGASPDAALVLPVPPNAASAAPASTSTPRMSKRLKAMRFSSPSEVATGTRRPATDVGAERLAENGPPAPPGPQNGVTLARQGVHIQANVVTIPLRSGSAEKRPRPRPPPAARGGAP